MSEELKLSDEIAPEPWQNLSLKDIDGEEWRSINGFEDCYEISSLGRVKSLSREVWSSLNGGCHRKLPERILKQCLANEQLVVTCYNNGHKVNKGITTLMRYAFIRDVHIEDPYFNIYHKDSNPLNNRLSNIDVRHKGLEMNFRKKDE